jgi:3',5'-cyclic-AMP phosphodiesterase
VGDVTITRRVFIQTGVLTGATVALGPGWFPTLNTLEVAHAQETVRFAWISDTHLYPKSVNTRFVDTSTRAVKDVARQAGQFDFLIFGGDLAQLGRKDELDLGKQILSELKIRQLYIPGEHDWYYDMGQQWQNMFGRSPWSMDHKGIHFVGLNTVGQAPDYWTPRRMNAEQRMAAMSILDGSIAGPWAGLGPEQLKWLADDLGKQQRNRPIVIFSHNPLYEVYPPWNFWVRDWKEVQEIIKPFQNVTNIHGHVHQVLYGETNGGKFRSIGQLATSWPWPYAPYGTPPLTRKMARADPGDPFDGVGWGRFGGTASKLEGEYMMWRKNVYAQIPEDESVEPPFLSPKLVPE